MKTITTTAIVALMTATTGLSAISPTFAQEAAPMQVHADNGPGFHLRRDNQGPGPMGGQRGGDFLNFARGAEAIEVALVHLSHRIELTSEQQALFDTLKTTALSAAADFETATEGLRPQRPVEGEVAAVTPPDMSERLENRIAIEKAHLAALEAVQPAATAFFDSLTDEQKAQLTPQRPDRDGMPGFGKGGPRHHQGGLPTPEGGPAAPEGGPAAPANG
ncbi:Spy/CpxP family protein refolding chaperone [Devosia oryziradicis]|uniref:Spy/CpxP family protein refolding chaperone n=1 Tax=Devosia oryziradicis TaxID=2801335 RepID=A0ABX7C0A2_9HYPH|nr:Spy/CpxP family protein refolding chaperone [Devosia oryziradicis]QQR37655.1 Spy/CpxP family protein refolding chaperone [Devosia oryziradicis]